MSYTPSQIRKTLVTVVGFLAVVASLALSMGGIIPAVAMPYVLLFISVAQVYGVFRVRNAELPGSDVAPGAPVVTPHGTDPAPRL